MNFKITFTLRDPNLRILGFFSILLVLCFLLSNKDIEKSTNYIIMRRT